MNTTMTRTRLDEVFKALASVHRRDILAILSEAALESGKTCCLADEVCACKLSDRIGLAPSTISHHMSVLRAAGLVEAREDGRWTYYALRREALDQAAESLRRI
jgi:DNA-binding transcriptional ArsR family regulator